MMEKSPTIALITKLNTPNAGNQAISTELIRLLQMTYPESRIFAGWQEHGLERYSLAMLRRGGSDPLRTLDLWADSILTKYNSKRHRKSQRRDERPTILKTYELSPTGDDLEKIVRLYSSVPNLFLRICNKGQRIIKLLIEYRKIYGSNFENWLNVLENSDWIVYSPAGAIINLNTVVNNVIRDLLGLRIAQKMGVRIAAVNQSIEVKDPLLLHLFGQFYSSIDVIVVRDPFSAKLLTQLNVPTERVKLAPDTAYLAQPIPIEERRTIEITENERIKPDTVGITVQPRRKAYDYSDWGKVIQMLRSHGKNVVFISHEMATDGPAGRELHKRFNVENISCQYNYREYISILSQLESIISERYHTCVFSAIANTPFIPINVWAQHKMHGIVWAFNYPITPVEKVNGDWVDLVLERINYLYQNYDRIKLNLSDAMLQVRDLAAQNVSQISITKGI